MGNFIRLIALSILAATGCLVYLVFEVKSCFVVKKISRGKKPVMWAVAVSVVLLAGLILFLTLGYINAMICIVFTAVFWLICRLIVIVINKITKRKFKLNYAGIVAVVAVTAYLSAGFYLAHAVRPTPYTIYSAKIERDLRFIHFSDSHIGALFDAEKFREYVGMMNAHRPDAVFITGDFVDDDTSREDMLSACAALSDFDAPLGVYFIYGNHDSGYYSEIERGWSNEELYAALESSGTVVLQDQTAVSDINIVGRNDMGRGERKGMGELLFGLDLTRFTVVLDHQPRDTEAEAAAKADLVLCGHTHGGQLFPMNFFIAAANDITYGHERIDDSDFIVSSGLGNWEIKFKTGCYAEYSVIDVKPE